MKIKIIIATLIIGILATGCEKILNKEPQDQLSVEKTFSDLQGDKTALAGAYKSLIATEMYHLNLMIYPDLMGGNIKYSKSSNQLLYDIYNLTQKPLDCSLNSSYEAAYKVLNNLNNVIKYTPEVPDATDQQRNKILADARSLRALIHFDLVNLYARPYNFTAGAVHPGIVLNLEPRLYNDPLPQRAPVSEVFISIINDLSAALTLYANSTDVFTGGSPQTYFNKDVVKAVLAKVYLYKGDWQNAYNYANDLIQNSSYKLLTNSAYVASWASRTPSSESIFELALESNFSGNSLGTYFDSSATLYQQFAATNDLLNLYSATDVRGKASLFNAQVINGNTYYFTKKYEKGGTSATPVKVLRLSELYLIRAEASAQISAGDLTSALADLNTIRLRADPAAAPLNISNQTALLDAIYTERRKELAFEGDLLFDLIRGSKNISRTDCVSMNCNVPISDNRLIMPVPTSTINVNPSLTQNPGY